MKLADRIMKVGESKTVQFTALLQEYAARGEPVINFAVGEPDFRTPTVVVAATKQALDDGKTRYDTVAGNQTLRTHLSHQFKGYKPENIVITNGAKQALYAIFQVSCDPGDEVLIPKPYWVSFSEQVKLASAVPIFVNTKAHQLDIQAISDAITPKTRAIIINTPNNPTGAVYPFEDLRRIADLAISHDLIIISDEAYKDFIYDGSPDESFIDIRDIRDRLVIVRSFSKTYSMTGFRLGFVVAPEKISKALVRLQSHLTGNVCTFAQEGALAALSLDSSVTVARLKKLRDKRDLAHGYVSKWSECIKPGGAFYLFPDVSRHMQDDHSSEKFAAYLLKHAGVAVVPGEAFGMPGHIRISYAVSKEDLIQGLERIAGIL